MVIAKTKKKKGSPKTKPFHIITTDGLKLLQLGLATVKSYDKHRHT
jgi:hypothetical protein